MSLDVPFADPAPKTEDVLDALYDDACREIVSALEEPMTVREISDATEVPLSTAYKKLDRLENAPFVAEETQIRRGGHHRSRYVTDFDRIAVELDAERDFRVEVDRALSDPERQLVGIWSEVRKET